MLNSAYYTYYFKVSQTPMSFNLNNRDNVLRCELECAVGDHIHHGVDDNQLPA
jgi:hypothetical protein